ncbi:hypothetical protein [Floridanema aerugineum]|uniref:Uncharacterized protein n=1 Tax=Floridaenema aerugineum BLCC-F46 TaxID=3153654 RepID=A0ABV4XEJ0_9CYAN
MFGKTLLSGLIIAYTTALPILSLNIETAQAQDRRDFKIINNTELTLTSVYVSSARSQRWGRNILRRPVMANGNVNINFSDSRSTQCVYDIKAVYEDGSFDVGRYNLCEITELELYGSGGDYGSSNDNNSSY